jgi:hypothetical protein
MSNEHLMTWESDAHLKVCIGNELFCSLRSGLMFYVFKALLERFRTQMPNDDFTQRIRQDVLWTKFANINKICDIWLAKLPSHDHFMSWTVVIFDTWNHVVMRHPQTKSELYIKLNGQ